MAFVDARCRSDDPAVGAFSPKTGFIAKFFRTSLLSTALVAVMFAPTAFAQQERQSNYWTNWPEASKKVADKMLDNYGEPHGVTPKMIKWNDAGPWKTIVVYKDPAPHNFPNPHKDVLGQTVNFEVPTDKFDDLAEFDGSVFAKRTSGVLGTTCDSEPMNMLTLNLAHDIIAGKKNIEEARSSFGEIRSSLILPM